VLRASDVCELQRHLHCPNRLPQLRLEHHPAANALQEEYKADTKLCLTLRAEAMAVNATQHAPNTVHR
jgi:hypothetical protein